MEALLILLCLYLFVALVVFPIWAIARITGLDQRLDRQRESQRELQAELNELRLRALSAAPTAPPPAPVVPPAPAPAPVIAAAAPPPPAAVVAPIPEPAPAAPPVDAAPDLAPPPLLATEPSAPPPPPPVYTPPPPAPSWTDSINWEQFMGAKLFAWLGGLALFLGVAFFVKYSFDHGWIPAEVRVALGFVVSAGLIVGGLRINRERFAITAQTLIAAGVVSLYAVTFSCNSVYHFAFFGPVATFLLMALITATAFVLAVRLEAQVVAVLGLLGGFLTPVLLSTGQDNPGGLFGYLALLNVGLIAVALRTGWAYLVPLGAGGTVLMMFGWTGKFFQAEKGPVAMTVALGFSALFSIAAGLARRRELPRRAYLAPAIALPLVGFGYAFYFLDFTLIATNAPLYFGFLFALDALLLRLAWVEEELPKLPAVSGLLAFALLALWMTSRLDEALLPWGLAATLGLAVLHTAFPLVLERRRPEAAPAWWSQLFPPLSLLLLLLPLARLDHTPFLLWPAILLADLLAIGVALLTASLAGVAAVMVLTLVATGLCLFRVPAHVAFDGSLLLVLGAFAVFFFAASLWLVRKLGDLLPADAARPGLLGDPRAQLPAFSALLPFLLLVMVCLRLTVPDPSMVFGLALLLVILTLGLTKLLAAGEARPGGTPWLPLCALLGLGAVEYAWHLNHLTPDNTALPLVWYLAFYLVFSAYPFLFRRDFAGHTGPWATAALAGVVHFPLVHGVFNQHPNGVMGLIPAAFAVLPLASLAAILKTVPESEPKRLNQLAWFGGAGLLFITLIFPVQFDRQWLTIAWALEGAALLWLFLRVPHPGLRLVGVGLLVTAFARLAFNPAVFSYHVRGDTPLLNWYLYAYGTVIAALFAGARLLTEDHPAEGAPPRGLVLGSNAIALLQTLGVVLLFLLLNIEIADFFTAPGARSLAFQFSGHFGRDMTYTIAWALFALGLLLAGIWRQQRAARYAAIALLSVALLKLFLHDMARLDALYKVGAFIGVAIIAILASFAYQRFLPGNEKTPPPAS